MKKPDKIKTLALLAAAAVAVTGCRTTRQPGTAASDNRGSDPDSRETAPPLPAEAAAKSQALAYYGLGLIDEYNRNFAGALSNFQEAVRFDPNNEELHLRIAIGLLQKKNPAEAVALMESLAQRRPDSDKALLALALIYRAVDDTEKMKSTYQKLIKLAPERPEPYVELAALYLRQGEEDEAIKLLERGAEKADDSSVLLRVLGQIYVQRAGAEALKPDEKKNREAAIRTFERAAAMAPKDVAILFQLGDLYIENRQIAKAIEVFQTIETLNPDNLQVKQKLAMNFLSVGDTESAIRMLESMSREQPRNSTIYYYLGELYEQRGDVESALLNFSLAANAEPLSPSPFMKMAQLQITSDPDAAIAALEEGLERLPENHRLLEMLAYVHFDAGRKDKALEYFGKTYEAFQALKPEQVNSVFYFNYAIASQRAGNIAEAASLLSKAYSLNILYLDAYLQNALKRDEQEISRSIAVLEQFAQLHHDEPNVHYYTGLLNSFLKQFPQAISAFEKAEQMLADSPDSDEALDSSFYFWYGSACERDGQFERAVRLFERCIELSPDHADALNYIAYMWAERGLNLDKALEYILKALELTPDNGAFIDTLGWIYYRQGDYESALKQIQRASQLIQDDPTILDHLGDVFDKLGDEEKALEQWKRSFVVDSSSETVSSKLRERGIDLDPLLEEAETLKQRKAAEDTPSSNDETLFVLPDQPEDQ